MRQKAPFSAESAQGSRDPCRVALQVGVRAISPALSVRDGFAVNGMSPSSVILVAEGGVCAGPRDFQGGRTGL